MLIRSLNVKYGLVNGAIGEVTHIHTNETASNSFITVRFPHVSLPSCLSDIPHHLNIENLIKNICTKADSFCDRTFL